MSVDCDVTRVYKRYTCELKMIEKKRKTKGGKQKRRIRAENLAAPIEVDRGAFFSSMCAKRSNSEKLLLYPRCMRKLVRAKASSC